MRKWVVVTALLCGSATGFAPTIAQQGEPPAASASGDVPVLSDEEALALDAQSYSARFSVPLEEAMRRILLMSESQDDVAALEQEFGDGLAGIYFDNGADFGLRVRLTGQGAVPDRTISRVRGVRRPAQAGRRAAPAPALEAASRALASRQTMPVRFARGAAKGRRAVAADIGAAVTELQRRYPELEGIGHDERRGVVVVQVAGSVDEMAAREQRALSARFGLPVEFEQVRGRLPALAARGGTRINYSGGGLNCTAGFIGTDPNGRQGIITAGHCFAIHGQSLFYTDTDGRRYELIRDTGLTIYSSKEDIMFLRFPAGLTGLGEFFANRNEGARAVTGRRTLSTTQTRTSTAQGTYICFYGMASSPTHGQGCGDVRFKEFAVAPDAHMTSSAGPSYYVHVQGPTSGMRCTGGDSGAPWFAFNTAFGVMSRCGENWIGTESVAYYTSLDAAYARNYRLVM
jgi:hypothetical protein